MLKEVGLAVTMLPAMVRTEGLPGWGAMLPMTKLPDGPNVTGVPPTFTPWPPGVRTVPAIGTADGFETVRTWLATVTTGGCALLPSFDPASAGWPDCPG